MDAIVVLGALIVTGIVASVALLWLVPLFLAAVIAVSLRDA